MKLLLLCLALVPLALGGQYSSADIHHMYNKIMEGPMDDKGGDRSGEGSSESGGSSEESKEPEMPHHGEEWERHYKELIKFGNMGKLGKDGQKFTEYLDHMAQKDQVRKDEEKKAEEMKVWKHMQDNTAMELMKSKKQREDARMEFKFDMMEQFVGMCKCDDVNGAAVLEKVEEGHYGMPDMYGDDKNKTMGEHNKNETRWMWDHPSVHDDVKKFAHFEHPHHAFYYGLKALFGDMCNAASFYLLSLGNLEEDVIKYRNMTMFGNRTS